MNFRTLYRGGLLSLLLLICYTAWGQKKKTIHGWVYEAKSGETLIGATVRTAQGNIGTATDNYGRYSLTLPEGTTTLVCSYTGFNSQTVTLTLKSDTTYNFSLDEGVALQEVTVVGHYNPSHVQSTQMSTIAIPASQIKRAPAIFGENDVIKTLQLLPGVQSGTEGASGIYVRGGGPDQNLIMIDGIPLYNVNHFGGMFSNFNTDAIKNVTLYKGSFPARFNGRLSSVIDVRMRDGDEQHYHGTASIGLISSRVNVEGPIIKGKTTFNLSARRTYFDILTRPVIAYMQRLENQNSRFSGGYYFYDLNLKLTHKLGERDKLFLSTYMGDDVLTTSLKERYRDPRDPKNISREFTNSLGWKWGNTVAALRWNHLIDGKLFLNTTVAYNQYRSKLHLQAIEKDLQNNPKNEQNELEVSYNSGVRDLSARNELTYQPNPDHNILLGTHYTYHSFQPDVSSLRSRTRFESTTISTDSTLHSRPIPANEFSLFVEDDWSINSALKTNLGLHYSLFYVGGRAYHSLEPRVNIRWAFTPDFSAKVGYALMSQYIHLLSTNNISLPTDLWVPATQRIEPMKAHQVTAGLFYHLSSWGDLSVEGYYKTLSNLLEYKDGAGFLLQSAGWEDIVSMGDGRAYGVEFLWQKQVGTTTGWVGYTWARSLRQFNRPDQMINEGEVFPAKYDRIHDFNITVMQQLGDKWDVSASWTFCTGNTGTLSFEEYRVPDFNKETSSIVDHITTRNNYRYNPTHRLDLSINYYKRYKNGHTGIWNLSVYNAYCNLNPYLVTKGYDNDSNPVLKQITIFPIIPAISYTYKF